MLARRNSTIASAMDRMTTRLYHITHISNLPALLQCAELRSKNKLTNSKTEYKSIAYEHIQDRRASISVPYGLGGTLHDYVPFYFAARSPMLYAIHKGYVEGYEDGQQSILHLVTSAESIANASLNFVFSDGHAVMGYTSFYDDLSSLSAVIDWEIMKDVYWHDTDDDGDLKRRRQAEFLVHQSVPWSLIDGIGVKNRTIADRVNQTLQEFGYTTSVRRVSAYYY